MSLIACEMCGAIIDTDTSDDFHDTEKGLVCWRCYEEHAGDLPEDWEMYPETYGGVPEGRV